MPLMQHNLDSPYCERLECYDAVPGGHGRAWARFPSETIQEIARWSDQRMYYTMHAVGGTPNLQYGVQLDKLGRCPMHRVQLPAAPHWSSRWALAYYPRRSARAKMV
eukprot:9761384-Heterocapsa_arctica.AAC.1